MSIAVSEPVVEREKEQTCNPCFQVDANSSVSHWHPISVEFEYNMTIGSHYGEGNSFLGTVRCKLEIMSHVFLSF